MTHTPYRPEIDGRYVITRSIDLPAPVERVWRAVSDADEIAHWFPNKSATLDLDPAAPGCSPGSGHGPFPIVVENLDEPHYLAWSWGHESTQSATTLVEWRLEETADGTRADRDGVGDQDAEALPRTARVGTRGSALVSYLSESRVS